MRLWCVDYAGLGWHISSKLFFKEADALEFYHKYDGEGFYHKIYQVTDIWNWTARHFEEYIDILYEENRDENGKVSPTCFINDVQDAALLCSIELSVEGTEAVMGAKYVEFVSVAWYYDEAMKHKVWVF
jgi:hypothetical protein